jgi:predicted ABC-type ATPase
MQESIEDKGILKALFVIGIPGSGKSYTVKQMKGTISPRVVNTDIATEYAARKHNVPANSANWPKFKDSAHRITKNALQGYINGMLPLFVDGTSNDVSNIQHRMGILKSLGYDVGVVYINTNLETAKARAKSRALDIGREVDVSFIEAVHKQSEENAAYLKSEVEFFRVINNDGDSVLTDKEMQDAFKAAQSFFAAPLQNIVGKRNLEKLKAEKQKYLAPLIMTDEALAHKIDGWYKT